MASSKATPALPAALRNTKSFTRLEGSANPLSRPKRASTLDNGSAKHPLEEEESDSPDAFETTSDNEAPEPPRTSVDLDDLPIEVVSMTDNFIDSLSAKVHPTPPNMDNLSRRFQEFYSKAAENIKTHISSLATRQMRRDVSPTPSNSSRVSAASLLRAKATSLGNREKIKDQAGGGVEQQMLTSEELADRKRARKALEAKRSQLEEAVERRLCEGIYDKIYRHRSTQDAAQDDKLRSKTAALDVVGIGPLELGIDIGETSVENVTKKVAEVRTWLERARKELILMNEKRYPLGKLNHLKAVHKEIVDTLAHFHPSSSADEIMPMLIYTLITLPPEHLNVVSDLQFIQRFRWEPKLVGEAAYCLTNLEATVAFLDTVDLSTLRADELPSGPPTATSTNSRPSTPKETFPPAYSVPGLSLPPESTTEANTSNVSALKPLPSPAGIRAAVQLRNRRLSDLVPSPAQALGAASDTIFNTADQGIKTISTSLGDSYNFLLGKLGAVPRTVGGTAPVQVPQTLDDARKLIDTPPSLGDDDSGSDDGRLTPEPKKQRVSVEDRVLALVSGKKTGARDRSVESVRSASSSSKKVMFAADDAKDKDKGKEKDAAAAPGSGLFGMARSLNPVSQLGAGVSMLRGFARSTSTPPVSGTKAADSNATKDVSEGGDLATAFPDIATALPPKVEVPKIAPPIQRFLDIQDPGDLKLREALELLRDYRRLAAALRDMGAFES